MEDPIATDPDLDGNAAFAVNPPGPGEMPSEDYILTVTPAAIDGSQKVPIRFFVEQLGEIREPIDSNEEPTEGGYLLGEMDSDTSRDFWFRLLFVL